MNNIVDKKQHCAALFVDLYKAFDTVDNNILLNKLLSVSLDDSAYSWFKSHLSGNVQTVIAKCFQSSPQMLYKGVPKGSVLGPCHYIKMGTTVLNWAISIIYADDTILYVINPTANLLQITVYYQWPPDLSV